MAINKCPMWLFFIEIIWTYTLDLFINSKCINYIFFLIVLIHPQAVQIIETLKWVMLLRGKFSV